MLATHLTDKLDEFAHMTGAIDTILNSMYVDDILDSTNCSDELEKLKTDVETILKRGGFRIKVWLKSGVRPADKEATISLLNAPSTLFGS